MNHLEQTIAVYEKLRKGKYRIVIEDGTVVELRFKKENYHHLVGLQHLKDFPDIANPKQGKQRFYNDVKRGKITGEKLERSVKYPLIEERIRSFGTIAEIMVPGEQKIIVQFDKTQLHTVIEAVYFLYKRRGTPYTGDYMVHMLFLGQDKYTGEYFPTTYVAEASNRYISGQQMLDCSIELLLPKSNAHR